MRLTDRCVLLRSIVFAIETTIEIQWETCRGEREADIVLQDLVLLSIAFAEIRTRRVHYRIVAARGRIVERGAEETEPIPQAGQLFESEAEGGQLRISIIVVGAEVTRSDIDARIRDLQLQAPIQAALFRQKNGRERGAAVDGREASIVVANRVGEIIARGVRVLAVVDFHRER